MSRYVLRRILEAIPALLGVTIISFILLHIIPGNPVRILLGNHYTAYRAAILKRNLGLDKPLYMQYLLWLWKALHGNFQYSYVYNRPVTALILSALPHTLELVALAIIIAHLGAVLIGTFQAYYADTWFDQVITVILYFFYAMPVFWLGVLVIEAFAIHLNWFPTGGITNPNNPNPNFWSYVYHLILPGVTLAVVSVAGWARYMRSTMRETLVQDYIRTARSKGAGEFRVLLVHALRNSVLPLITLFGLSLPALFGGALVVEEIFNYPGMGLLFWNAALDLDMPVLLAIIVFLGAITILGNLIADLLYALVDPRISYT
ncbi:MAG: ABC transporter permease [Sulfobacillus acidophilus]|uniref:ABC transporter permease n=1 Tax=Sulfobacillus acidophilus TaxID=53633 RepID=A0A2T2WHK2_9FIRM|nr:MAG: ABC transporter permease [Sulfobacillus acidophilus]